MQFLIPKYVEDKKGERKFFSTREMSGRPGTRLEF